MGFLPSILSFSGIALVPYFAPVLLPIVTTMFGLGIMGDIFASYAIPFIGNWIINFGSDYWFYFSNCSGTKTASIMSLVWAAMIPGFIAAIFGFVLNFIPILKTPLLIFAIGGGMWIVDVIVNIIGNYGIASGVTWGMRAAFLKSSCKKSKK